MRRRESAMAPRHPAMVLLRPPWSGCFRPPPSLRHLVELGNLVLAFGECHFPPQAVAGFVLRLIGGRLDAHRDQHLDRTVAVVPLDRRPHIGYLNVYVRGLV